MAELVRVQIKTGNRITETNVGRSFAEALELKILDESVESVHGRPRVPSRKDGRPILPTTSVAEEVKKSAPKKDA